MKLLNDISLIDRRDWSALVDRSPVTSVFQSPEFADFIMETGLYDVVGVGVEENDVLVGVIVCLIQAEGKGLKRRCTARAIVNGGPLLDEKISAEALTLLLNETSMALKRRCVYVETRNFNDYSRWKTTFESCGFAYLPHYNFHIDTTSMDVVDGNMGKSRRRDIKYTVREGASAVEASTQEEVDAFYGILSALYEDKVRRPLFPLAFFRQVVEKPYAHLIVVRFQDEVVGGSLCLELEKHTMYEWFVCGEDHTWKNVHPSELATYEAMRLAVSRGCRRFDMMGAGEPDKAYGVRDFKAHFGGVLVEHGRFLHVNRRLVYAMGKWYVGLKSKQ